MAAHQAPPSLGFSSHTMEYYLAIKKNERMSSAATLKDPEIIILSQTEKDKRIIMPLICEI